ncbi:hypothetical protein HDU99_000017 [Rhizoclosmatium hyalinum]|nr:hypothetical protein HDU99_000017 [Rhizoclosmatium hyalinum]
MQFKLQLFILLVTLLVLSIDAALLRKSTKPQPPIIKKRQPQELACGTGLTMCNERCVNLFTSENHCGSFQKSMNITRYFLLSAVVLCAFVALASAASEPRDKALVKRKLLRRKPVQV